MTDRRPDHISRILGEGSPKPARDDDAPAFGAEHYIYLTQRFPPLDATTLVKQRDPGVMSLEVAKQAGRDEVLAHIRYLIEVQSGG